MKLCGVKVWIEVKVRMYRFIVIFILNAIYNVPSKFQFSGEPSGPSRPNHFRELKEHIPFQVKAKTFYKQQKGATAANQVVRKFPL